MNFFSKVSFVFTNINYSFLKNTEILLNFFEFIYAKKTDIYAFGVLMFEIITEVKYKEAIKYYKIAIDEGDIESMYDYACMLFDGKGVEVNNKETIKYFKMAIDKGNVDAMLNYAINYLLQNGVHLNPSSLYFMKYIYKMQK